ncbi:MAG: phage tail domain-containing protein [Dehalococcoidia bacterium]
MVDSGGFTLDGVAASAYSVTLRYGPGQPMLPATRDRTVEIPGRAGVYWFDSDVGQRIFSLPCDFRDCADAAALDVLIKAFARALVDVNGKPKALSLTFDDSPTITYTVRYSGEIPFERAWCGVSEFTLNLVADEPFGREDEEVTTGTITTSPGTLSVTGTCTVASPCKICITNNGASPIAGFTVTIGGWTVL